ncbi:SET domain-containing protein [Patellaria atrata CBS 101060]|uniref:SET domain-containing protein n=1 Tax=Patellaria atrata CBS 101060 TaxID=1346257 RepID=A0A9P4S9G0_9PEZI|nr:SET domain-containing protein [Patellaria atrata CBS 101060]
MIRRGRKEGWFKNPITTFRPWAEFNGTKFDGIRIGPLRGLESRGSCVIATRDLSHEDDIPLVVVPNDLILSLEGVQLQAKSDKRLHELLEALGHFGKTTRGAVLTFLLLQATIACPDIPTGTGVQSPLTEYVKFLPEEMLPTFWSEEERELLIGTTLKPAVEAKLQSLQREFGMLKETTQAIEWCAKYWWDDEEGFVTFDDWKQVDAMYRSRALEFPGIGDAMVPCVDMANHAAGAATMALYESDNSGNGILLLREEKMVKEGNEITITYGDEKGACEMLFSYGFLETSMNTASVMFLDVKIPEDDPLKAAKMAISNSAPGIRIFDKGESTDWESDFMWLICINEEDGLEFDVMQTTDGDREIRASWKGTELLDPSKIRELLQADPMWDVYRLRATAIVQDRVEAQLRLLFASEDFITDSLSNNNGRITQNIASLAGKLRRLETELLERAYGELEDQKIAIANSDVVKSYLEFISQGTTVLDEDFS